MRLLKEIKAEKVRLESWMWDRLNRDAYPEVRPADLRNRRTSDTVFIFGSGYSLNDIPKRGWDHIRQHDIISFNWFVRQDFVPVNFHFVREIVGPGNLDPEVWKPRVREYADEIKKRGLYDEAVFVVQEGWKAINGNRMVGLDLLPEGAPVFRYRNDRTHESSAPNDSFEEGLMHRPGTLVDCLNFAYLLDWDRVVLAGVDLYDRRYFWLDEDETGWIDERQDTSHEEEHNTAQPIVELVDRWLPTFADAGIKLYVENPKSLLTKVLPVYDEF